MRSNKPSRTRIAALRLAALFALPSAVSACAVETVDRPLGATQEKVVFGDEDRIEYDQIPAGSRERRWADATGMMLYASGLHCSGGSCSIDFRYDVPAYGVPICEGELGAGQPTADTGGCTAFLVGPQLFATAGHCFFPNEVTNCSNIRVAFGFVTTNGVAAEQVPQSDVYTCTQVISSNDDNPDYAVFKVDRPVTGRTPLWIRRSGQAAIGQALTVVSYPIDLPLKLDQGAVIKAYDTNTIAVTSDTATGASGGPTINTATGVVEAVHANAPLDAFWVYNAETPDECVAWVQCPESDGCPDFAGATRTDRFHQYVPLHPVGIVAAVM
jgi:hypothetical protein